jgi:hypothetical protein
MEVAPDFDEFIGCLTAHGVDFVIVGAYALAFHGAPRPIAAMDNWGPTPFPSSAAKRIFGTNVPQAARRILPTLMRYSTVRGDQSAAPSRRRREDGRCRRSCKSA